MIFKTPPADFAPRFTVVSCFMEHDGHLLALHRHENKSQGGKWGFPAGKIEEGETMHAAMVREIQEESRLITKESDLEFCFTVFVRHGGYDFVYHKFRLLLAERPTVTINDYEHQNYAWVPIKKVLELPLIDDEDKCVGMYYFPTS